MATPPTFTNGTGLDASSLNAVGMWLIKTQTFTNVATTDIVSIFSSDYDWYRFEFAVNSTVTTSGQLLQCRLLNGTTPEITNYASGFRAFNVGIATATWDGAGTNGTFMYAGIMGEPNYSPASGFIEVFYPAAARHTTMTGQSFGLSSSVAYYNTTVGGYLATTTQYTGMRFFPSANNMTGTIRVYGIRN